MAENPLPYDHWVEDAFRDVIRRALVHAAEKGLPGEHHFYVSFRTTEAGVRISKPLKAQYPETMTIVLQHKFEDLAVDDEGFSVTLRFGGKPERLRVPFATVTSFNDPSVNFGIQLRVTGAANTDEATPPVAGDGKQDTASAESGAEAPAKKVVALDAFRKK